MARLQHAQHEAFARLVAAGMPRYKAYATAVARTASQRNMRALASDLWRGKGLTSRNIQKRVQEIMIQRRRSVELTAEKIADDILLDCDLATAAGHHAAAITGRKLLANELFGMFKDRKEIVNLEIKATNNAELRAMIAAEYGEDVAQRVWDHWSKPPKLIEHDPSDHDVSEE